MAILIQITGLSTVISAVYLVMTKSFSTKQVFPLNRHGVLLPLTGFKISKVLLILTLTSSVQVLKMQIVPFYSFCVVLLRVILLYYYYLSK